MLITFISISLYFRLILWNKFKRTICKWFECEKEHSRVRLRFANVFMAMTSFCCKRKVQTLWKIMSVFLQNCKNTTTVPPPPPKKKKQPKTLAGTGNWTRNISHPRRMHYLCTTESTERNDCSQAIQLFDAMCRKVIKQGRICGQHIFNKFMSFCIIFICMDNYIWRFLIFTEVGVKHKYC